MEVEKYFEDKTQENTEAGRTINSDESEDFVSSDSFLSCLLLPRKQINKALKTCKEKLNQLTEAIKWLGQGYQQCVKDVKTCQEQTEKILRYTLEKHALEPAIKTVVDVSDEVLRLDGIAQKLLKSSESNDELKTLANELRISATITTEKLTHLDINRLIPSKGKRLDPKLCDVCNFVNTQDKALHGRIGKLISPGLLYRGKVLRQPKVSVFRYIEAKIPINRHNRNPKNGDGI